MGIFVLHFGSLGDAETKNKSIKVVEYAVKIHNARMCIIIVSSICSIAYKNVTSGTHNGTQ